MQLTFRQRVLDLSTPVVMGIVNVTPDSFSDGGRFADAEAAFARAIGMVEAGAAIVDLGAESTRPGSGPVPAEEQLERLMPVLDRLRDSTDALLSVDTGSAEVIRAVAGSVDMVNDVYALRLPGALEAAADAGLAVCLMHMQGTPKDMQDEPRYEDLVGEIVGFLRARVDACMDAGIDRSRIVVDPGFGFGKTNEQNLALLDNLGSLRELGLPVLAGLSRKGTLGAVTGRAVDQRLAAGLAAAVLGVERGARIVRTHDVPETVDALKIVAAVNSAGSGLGIGPAG